MREMHLQLLRTGLWLFILFLLSLPCPSFSVLPFPLCVSWGSVSLVLLYALFLDDFLHSFRDNHHLYVDGHLICISTSRTSDLCIYCWGFHLYILQYPGFRVCTADPSPPRFSLPCPPLTHRHILSLFWSSGPRVPCIFHQDAQVRNSPQSQFNRSSLRDFSWFLTFLFFSPSPVLLFASGHYHFSPRS